MQSKVIGLTGGIATGKSHVSSILRRFGYPTVDADLITHQVQSKGSRGLKAIVNYFGLAVLTSDGQLNRKKLGQIVFSDSNKLKSLVRIIDPFIRHEIINQIKEYSQNGAQRIVLDAPTLFENGYQYLADQIVVVACDPVRQLQRLRSRDGLSIQSAIQRIDSQWPLEIKERLADLVINSDGSFDQTRNEVIKLINNGKL